MNSPRVILVEDDPLVAMMMEDLLAELGCEIAGSFGALAPAMTWLAAQQTLPDGAVLDVNLGGGETVRALAWALRERGVPFIFATGYGALPDDDFPAAPLLHKPVDSGKLAPALQAFTAAA